MMTPEEVEEYCNNNIWLAEKVAGKYPPASPHTLEDFRQVACIAMFKFAARFNGKGSLNRFVVQRMSLALKDFYRSIMVIRGTSGAERAHRQRPQLVQECVAGYIEEAVSIRKYGRAATPTPAEILMEKDMLELALSKFNPIESAVLRSRCNDCSLQEVADEVGIGLNEVDNSLFSIRRKLRKRHYNLYTLSKRNGFRY